jgi:hypothetical protein
MKTKHGRTIPSRAAGLALAGVLALPATAAAAIAPGHGVAGVKLGDSTARVTAVLGKPVSVQKYKGGQSWFWGKGPVDWVTMRVRGRSTTVRGIETWDSKQRTAGGIGVGSSMTALRKAYPHLTCKNGWLGHPYSSCWILTAVAGKKIPTNFVLMKGKPVSTIDIGEIGERNLAPQP